ncbi:hypothetical protein NM208_g17183 [Fusarium decemcellulare]|uniref:Uncharacterized protein n=1 Tax=Fusarium decemcellulare TaxID=57161 RepID=A0ACC1RC81_9HYPO|nr:hypothetical protein NM208_g17183 [Fusarium decemcellulare]
MASTFDIYGYDDNPRTRIVKIVAAAEGITLNQSLVVPRKGINKAAYMEVFPLSQGKIPAIEGNGVRITETIAITYPKGASSRFRWHSGTGIPGTPIRQFRQPRAAADPCVLVPTPHPWIHGSRAVQSRRD